METPVVKSRGRRRKRREDSPIGDNQGVNGNANDDGKGKKEVQNTGNPRRRGRPPKKRVVEMWGEAMVGRYVLKEFDESGLFLGKIVSYDSDLYRVDYEDGDCEDLDSGELREFLIGDERQKFVGKLLERKKKLDEAIGERSGTELKDETESAVELKDEAEEIVILKDEPTKVVSVEPACLSENMDASHVTKSNDGLDEGGAGNVVKDVKVEVPTSSDFPSEDVNGSDIDGNDDGDKDNNYCSDDDADDSCSDYREYGQGWETRADTEIPAILPLELPPSSGTIGVPEEYVSHLFSVHGFLRIFSVRLFLSPFTLDDLVGCLKCTTPNTLLDAIHVALLKALRRYLERLASEESQPASNCLRSIDWSLLDYLTWPAYLIHYLMAMGHLNGPEWKGFYIDVLEKDYCTLSVGIKLTVLQILCDDALDTKEIRSEIDTRVESEVGVGSDGISSNPVDGGPRQVYPRYSKTSVDKNRDKWNAVAENSVLVSSKTVKSDDQNRDTDYVGEDDNGDECRLCGMEGMLVCCDGCPSAYHSRCIGVNKLSIPDGKWFCPECTISRIGPPIINGTSLRGAEVFGMDSYAQLFLGTCNHLLVLKVSLKASSFVRYYNCNDVPKVLSVLSSSPHHSVSYIGICQAISKYWELPPAVVSPLIVNQASMILEHKDYRLLQFQSHSSDENMNEKLLYNVGNGTYASSVAESSIYDASGLGSEKLFPKSDSNDVSLGAPMQNGLLSVPYPSVACMSQNATNMTNNLSEQAATNMTNNLFEQAGVSQETLEQMADQSAIAGISLSTAGYASNIVAGHSNGVCLPNTHMQLREDRTKAAGRTSQKKKDTCLYMGSIFKPFAYINSYVHGAFAASAAANFAGLSSDENHVSEGHASDPRKAMAASVSLQVKAFSAAAVRFFWPGIEKKLIEISRERCSWCFHCKASVSHKKSCLLNQAAVNATRAEMKFISALRLEKIVEGSLYGIAAYTLYMEECIRGLILGPFQSSSYREQWRKKVEQVSSFSELKSLLLDLERNLWTIALSSEWTNLVDTWMDECSVPQSVAASGSVQKRVAGKRKKHLATPEATDDDPDDSNELCWWRGGKLAKILFQRGTLPRQVLKKAARQGGSSSLAGVHYTDSSDVPKRSRQFIWRTAVEMAKNASQLALQVRYLDQHIKWSDLVRPEQNPVDGKGPETEAFAFRNAEICDKKIMGNKILYGVAFGHKKHLSSRLMKSIIEKEESSDGKDKYWLPESRIPLYLVKEYEEKAEKPDLSPPLKPDRYSKCQRRQLKASRRDIFVYLAHKRDDLHVCPCASCHKDVLLELAVTCSSCEGYCHNTCMLSSTGLTHEDIEFKATCKNCAHRKFLTQANNNVESPTSPLAMQGKDFQNSAALAKSGKSGLKSKSRSQQSLSVEKKQGSDFKSSNSKKRLKSKSRSQQSLSVEKKSGSDFKSSNSKKRSSLHRGLKWRKKISDDGSDFRLRNVILRGSSDGLTLNPECHLCNKAYDPHLTYIRCEACKRWYHAEAVELDESKLSDLVGFKCCRCRRIRSPDCPYADVDPRKIKVTKLRINGPKMAKVESSSISEAIFEQAESLPPTPMSLMKIEEDVFFEMDDPLSLPVSQAEQQMFESKSEMDFEWNNFGPAPQKLQVRRQKNERDDEGLTWNDLSSAQLPTSAETKNFSNGNVEWDICNGGLEDGTALNYDNLNFESDYEPQTYFSFTELLEADGGSNQLEGVDAPTEAWDDFPCEYSQNEFMEQFNVNSFDELTPKTAIEPAIDVLCQVCQVPTPAPDLACQICGIKIHHHCSPWGNTIFQGDSWICGQCREWSQRP